MGALNRNWGAEKTGTLDVVLAKLFVPKIKEDFGILFLFGAGNMRPLLLFVKGLLLLLVTGLKLLKPTEEATFCFMESNSSVSNLQTQFSNDKTFSFNPFTYKDKLPF